MRSQLYPDQLLCSLAQCNCLQLLVKGWTLNGVTEPWDLVPCDPLTSCVTTEPVSPSAARGGQGLCSQASRASPRPGPLSQTHRQGVRGWGGGSSHQRGGWRGHSTGWGGGPGAAQ